MRLRVLTFNVQNAEGEARRTELLNRELRRLAPDLVAFQEVCYPDQRDQLAELVAGTGLTATTHQAQVLEQPPRPPTTTAAQRSRPAGRTASSRSASDGCPTCTGGPSPCR